MALEDGFGDKRKEYPHYVPAHWQEYWDSYFMFTFVRNPWERLVSTYLFDAEVTNTGFPQRRKTIKDMEKRYGSAGFEHFVLTRLRDYSKVYPLYQPQVKWLRRAKYNFIGRFENLKEDFDYVCDKIGGKQLELPHTLATSHGPYQEYYNADTKEVVAHMYKADIEKLKYEF